MVSPGLVVNLIFVALASFVFYRSHNYLLSLLHPEKSKEFEGNFFNKAVYVVGLVIWFLAGVMTMVTGLTGLLNRMILAIQ